MWKPLCSGWRSVTRIFPLNLFVTIKIKYPLPETVISKMSFTIFTGRDIAMNLLEVHHKENGISIDGFVGKAGHIPGKPEL